MSRQPESSLVDLLIEVDAVHLVVAVIVLGLEFVISLAAYPSSDASLLRTV